MAKWAHADVLDNGLNYINLPKLINRQGTGTIQRLEPIETELIRRGETVIGELRKDAGNDKALKALDEYYNWADAFIRNRLMQP